MARYVGRGAFVPGIPARDLTVEEVARFGVEDLRRSGIYELEEPVLEEESDGIDEAEASIAGRDQSSRQDEKE